MKGQNGNLGSVTLMGFFSSESFLTPFLATLGASLTIIVLQFIQKDRKDKDKKMYAISYVAEVCYQILNSNLIIKRHTIIPHIEATTKMIEGDDELLKIAFSTDEFDILTDQSFDFNLLPEEYKVLLGCDDIRLVQSYEILVYMEKNERLRLEFNKFVKQNLKSEYCFRSQTSEKQKDILNTYRDYLYNLEKETNRSISLIRDLFLLAMKKYIARKDFWFYSKKNVSKIMQQIKFQLDEFQDILPDRDFIPKSIKGGIQKVVSRSTNGDGR